jgi:DNA-binding transcriptional LysR family regulator
LFDRLGREVRLTPAGLIFYEYAVDMLNTRDHATSSIQEYYNGVKGELNIASSTTPCKYILPPMIKEFLKIHPDVRFKITGTSTGEVISRILSFKSEIGIVGRNIPDDRLSYWELADDNLVAITPKDKRFNKDESGYIEFKDLLSENFILREKSSATRQIFDFSLISSGYNINKLNILSEVDSMDTALQFVKYGLGVTIMSEDAAKDYIESGFVRKYYIKDLSLKRKIYLVKYEKKTISPAAAAFERFVKSYGKNIK